MGFNSNRMKPCTLATLLALICASLLVNAAEPANADITYLGKSSGVFTNPQGDAGMVSSGLFTDQFTWGEESNMRQGINRLAFSGIGFIAKPESPFTVGTLSYYNGDTRTSTNADKVELKITLAFENGTKSSFPVSLNLVSTPNKRTHYENADIVEIINLKTQSILKIEGKPYTITLTFGETSEDGYSMINRFHVFEGFEAQAKIRAELTPYTPPAPPKAELSTSRAQEPPVSRSNIGSLASSTSKSPQSTEPTPSSLPNTNAHTFNQEPKQPSSPSRFTSTSSSPSSTEQPRVNANTTPSRLNALNTQPSGGKLDLPTINPITTTAKTKPASTASSSSSKPSTHISGQASYLAPSSFKVQRAVKITFFAEKGMTYQVQISTDDVNWKDFGAAHVGQGADVSFYEPITSTEIQRYRIKVTQTH